MIHGIGTYLYDTCNQKLIHEADSLLVSEAVAFTLLRDAPVHFGGEPDSLLNKAFTIVNIDDHHSMALLLYHHDNRYKLYSVRIWDVVEWLRARLAVEGVHHGAINIIKKLVEVSRSFADEFGTDATDAKEETTKEGTAQMTLRGISAATGIPVNDLTNPLALLRRARSSSWVEREGVMKALLVIAPSETFVHWTKEYRAERLAAAMKALPPG